MKKLSLQSGVKLQLQFPDETRRDRYQVTVIGYVEGRSLMITAPKKNGNFILLREGQQFVVRLLSGTQIIGFNSEVLKAYNNSFSYKPPRPLAAGWFIKIDDDRHLLLHCFVYEQLVKEIFNES